MLSAWRPEHVEDHPNVSVIEAVGRVDAQVDHLTGDGLRSTAVGPLVIVSVQRHERGIRVDEANRSWCRSRPRPCSGRRLQHGPHLRRRQVRRRCPSRRPPPRREARRPVPEKPEPVPSKCCHRRTSCHHRQAPRFRASAVACRRWGCPRSRPRAWCRTRWARSSWSGSWRRHRDRALRVRMPVDRAGVERWRQRRGGGGQNRYLSRLGASPSG